MIKKEKVLVIITDGVGLKNFSYTKFPDLLKSKGFEFNYWNSTPFNLEKLDIPSIPLTRKVPLKTDLLKRAKIDIELDSFSKKFKSNVYHYFKSSKKSTNIKSSIKNLIVNFYKIKYKNSLGNLLLSLDRSVMNSKHYQNTFKIIKDQSPSLLFCTNQRSSNLILPLFVAKKLQIPTVCFIFSWDNLPKATKIVSTDYYLVWSDFMKNELLQYYPNILERQIHVVGSPQFEPHFTSTVIDLKKFKIKYNIKANVKYILFSGDDITTSPKDEQYLEAVCDAVSQINSKSSFRIEILFRRCPVDFSARYDQAIKKHSSIVTIIKPYWEKQGEAWNSIMPTKADPTLLANTISVCDLVINLGSSMVFDAACHNKPCAYINFNPNGIDIRKWSVEKIYSFIHFKSMPNKDAVIWLNSKEELKNKILEGLNNPDKYVHNAKKWFEIINQHPPQKATERIVGALKTILYKS